MSSSHTRTGLLLFTIYLVLYGGFVLLNAFAPESMERTPWAGVNLAVLYGFGLILAAFILSVIHGITSDDSKDDSDHEGPQA